MKFHQLLKAFRDRNKLTQERAAELISENLAPFEVTLRAWRNYEQGTREPSIPVRQVIEQAINQIEK